MSREKKLEIELKNLNDDLTARKEEIDILKGKLKGSNNGYT